MLIALFIHITRMGLTLGLNRDIVAILKRCRTRCIANMGTGGLMGLSPDLSNLDEVIPHTHTPTLLTG